MRGRAYDSVDAAAEVYFSLVVQLDLPSSQQGPAAGAVCAHCMVGALTMARTKGGKGEDRLVCSDCRQPWVALDLTTAMRAPRSRKMKRLSTKRPPRRPGDARCMVRLDDLMPLRPIFEPCPRGMTKRDWAFHRMCLAAQTYKRLSVAKIVEDARQHRLPAPRGWTEDTVRGALERITAICQRRMEAAEMWVGPREGKVKRWRKPRSSSPATRSASASA